MSVSKKGNVWLVRTQINGRDVRRTAPTRKLALELDAALQVSRFYDHSGLTPSKLSKPPTKGAFVPTWVYFIQTEDGPIKIGIANDPLKRLAELQTSHHAPLKLLGVSPGTLIVERKIHKQLDAHRLQGEWFRPDPEVLA